MFILVYTVGRLKKKNQKKNHMCQAETLQVYKKYFRSEIINIYFNNI